MINNPTSINVIKNGTNDRGVIGCRIRSNTPIVKQYTAQQATNISTNESSTNTKTLSINGTNGEYKSSSKCFTQ